MTDVEKFLARWARRKREAIADRGAKDQPDRSADAATANPGTGAEAKDDAKSDAAEPAADVASLPAIESITAETDIRAFLAPGIPRELAAAALRRAWSADPAIRDFVGLADYDWDFNTPGTMPGFGALASTDDVREAVAQILKNAPPGIAPHGMEPAVSDRASLPPVPGDVQGGVGQMKPLLREQVPGKEIEIQSLSAAAEYGSPNLRDKSPHNLGATDESRQRAEKREDIKPVAHRIHGGALPK
jgi:hypothetical protein